MFLRNSRHPLSSATIYGLPSTKGTGVICRVPSPEFALSLSFLNQSTCVGFEYGLYKGVFPAEQVNLWSFVAFLKPFRASFRLSWHTSFEIFPIDNGIRLFLRDRLTLRCFPVQRNPMTFGFFDSHEDIRYSYQHSHPCVFQKSFHSFFTKKQGGLLPFVHTSWTRIFKKKIQKTVQ